MRNSYSIFFDPPAPTAGVFVRNPQTDFRSRLLELQIDTGADITLLPSSIVELPELGLTIEGEIEIAAFDLRTSRYRTVQAQVILGNKRISGKYCLIDDEIGILGRDVLNHVALLLDGPAKSWSMIDSIDSDKAVS